MINPKKYNTLLQYFVLFLTISALVSCNQQKFYLTKIEGQKLGITNSNAELAAIENYIKPYRDSIDTDLNATLAYAPQTIDKSGEWQSPLGSLQADVSLERGNLIFKSREKKSIDICLLNHGGIRAIINKGNVTSRTAFEIMPFENSLIVIGLKGNQIKEIASYIIESKKPQPLSGMTFSIDKNNNAQNILVQGKPIDETKTYYVATSDYLSNGGDNMKFFAKSVEKYDLDYKLRNVLIDYFKEVDTIPIINDKRIIVE